MLLVWLGEIKGYPRAWSTVQIEEISSLLSNLNGTKPLEIHRRIISLKQIKHWKGTEYRTLLLYAGIVIFKDFLSIEEYSMFLKLFCAVTICSTNAYSPYLSVARNLFIDFIEMHKDLYEEHSITINIHLLSHVVDDVEHLGPLCTISAYPFENRLHHIKLRLKQCNRPLEQIARRLQEGVMRRKNLDLNSSYSEYPKFDKEFISAENPNAYSFRRVQFNSDVIFSSVDGNRKDEWMLTHENNIVAFSSVVKLERGYFIRGRCLKQIEDFFKSPFNSSFLNIFMSDGVKNDPAYFSLASIKAKLFCMPYKDNFVFVPLLHTL